MILSDCEVDFCCYIVLGLDGIWVGLGIGESDGKLMGIRIREGWWVKLNGAKKI